MFFNSSPAGRWSNRIQIHIPNQPLVEKYTRFYKGQGRKTIKDSFDRAWPFIPVMADILESFGVPAEMLSVVLVESRFKRHASYRGAGGYWQLLAATARSMGLRVDRWVDERMDPVKSTQAAAKYLRSFYEKYHSWPLALAAYNAGDGPVSGALKRSGASDFWELSNRGGLPAHTRVYVPKVLAAIRIMRDPEAFGFERLRNFQIYDFESIWIRAQTPLHLEQVARWVDVPVSHMRDLNPSLRMDRLPPEGGFNLHLPSGARDKFDLAYAEFLRR
jgi:membrane-bound lytic murein transglycosylase D